MSGDTWLRIDVYKPNRAGDQQALEHMKKSIEAFLNSLEKQKQPGFQLGYWGRNQTEGTISAVSYWNSHSAIDGAAGVLRTLQSDAEAHGVREIDSRNINLFAVPAAR